MTAMKTKHTPGPWARNISPKYPVYAEDDHRKVAIALSGHGVSDDEAMANLKLIAAAPTMLEALKEVRDLLGNISNTLEQFADTNSRAEEALYECEIVYGVVSVAIGRAVI